MIKIVKKHLKITSILLVAIKFLFVYKPIKGFSFDFGTSGFNFYLCECISSELLTNDPFSIQSSNLFVPIILGLIGESYSIIN